MRALMMIREKHLKKLEGYMSEERFEEASSLAGDTGAVFDDAVLNGLVARALGDRTLDTDSKLDSFLAPRLHVVLRMPRMIAARPGVWAWLACGPMLPYMRQRWPKEPDGTWWRYNSKDLLRNGVARLWWGAEMLRSAADYTLVARSLLTVRRFMFISELKYSWHREAVRAFARVLIDREATDPEAQELSKLFNIYLKTRALELWDPTEPRNTDWDPNWASRTPTLAQVVLPDHELEGPMEGKSRVIVEEELYEWLLLILDDIRS